MEGECEHPGSGIVQASTDGTVTGAHVATAVAGAACFPRNLVKVCAYIST